MPIYPNSCFLVQHRDFLAQSRGGEGCVVTAQIHIGAR
jgi:hypothetical protein